MGMVRSIKTSFIRELEKVDRKIDSAKTTMKKQNEENSSVKERLDKIISIIEPSKWKTIIWQE